MLRITSSPEVSRTAAEEEVATTKDSLPADSVDQSASVDLLTAVSSQEGSPSLKVPLLTAVEASTAASKSLVDLLPLTLVVEDSTRLVMTDITLRTATTSRADMEVISD